MTSPHELSVLKMDEDCTLKLLHSGKTAWLWKHDLTNPYGLCYLHLTKQGQLLFYSDSAVIGTTNNKKKNRFQKKGNILIGEASFKNAENYQFVLNDDGILSILAAEKYWDSIDQLLQLNVETPPPSSSSKEIEYIGKNKIITS